MLNTDSVHIWRDADGDYHLEWEASHPDTQVSVEPVGEGRISPGENRPGARVSGLPHGNRHFFLLRDQHGNEVLASERKLGLQGTPNFRDFGGYPTAEGRRVKWGYLFRSGQLSTLSDQDIDLLASLNLDLICDFRREEEQASDPSRLPEQRLPRVASLPIIPGSNSRFFEEAEQEGGGPLAFGRQAMFDFMVEINRDFAEGQGDTYARMFQEILALEDARFLVHCAAGKDRTGFAVALVLLALGVPREVVMRDYMLTARYFSPDAEMARLQKKYGMEHIDADAVRPMLEVHEDYLARGLESIEQNYGSVERYLREVLAVGSVELAELRARYLD
ncbi:tyrosine-protein phosphatase [Pseudohalioglobus lutimaris]|uniref:Protein-tyrosine-phosphatase n=1 Tax=Pseudohalioglobus lutimaris TaxID=1737061 RepID=A0A2N5WZE4_9GAMM|nr:tyrosine-protein phosphatase [Pseudohalioglobus lutimaris]PLW67611.1 protein-tyrosine-phosphatase [Pseudohalioglobus lutimaris]